MKLLCLGNGDNVGIRTYSWLKEEGHNVQLYRITADEDPLRGNPYLYIEGEKIDNDINIKSMNYNLLDIRKISLCGGGIIQKINNTFDAVIITGGWHALLFSRKIMLPKIFMPVGYEIHQKAREYRGLPLNFDLVLNFRQTLRNYFYGWLTRNSLNRTKKIFDWFPPTVAINKSLGNEKKILYMAFGEDIKKNKSLLNTDLVEKLNDDTKQASKVFLWLSRVNFQDPNKANYKGADLFIRALESFRNQLESRELMVFIGEHGEEVDAFKDFVKKSSIHPYIQWVNHLDHPDLLSYLAINKGVLFTDFGDINAGISGIGRDGYSVGIPMVNSNTDEVMIKQYTAPGPHIFAKSQEEIVSAMSYFINIGNEEFLDFKYKTLEYGKKYIDKKFFLKRILNEINLLLK